MAAAPKKEPTKKTKQSLSLHAEALKNGPSLLQFAESFVLQRAPSFKGKHRHGGNFFSFREGGGSVVEFCRPWISHAELSPPRGLVARTEKL